MYLADGLDLQSEKKERSQDWQKNIWALRRTSGRRVHFVSEENGLGIKSSV